MSQNDDPARRKGDPARRSGDLIPIPGNYQYRALHHGNPVQRFWHDTKRFLIGHYLPPAPTDHVLDVGCGSGVIADYLGESGANVIGLDVSPAAVAFARATFLKPNVRFQLALADEPFPVASPVDKIYCMEVIEHIHAPQARQMLEEFHRVLRPGGQLLITTPNYHSLWPLIEKALDRFSSAARMEHLQHVVRYTMPRLTQTIQEAGFTLETTATACLAAPWLAPINNRLAQKVRQLETAPRQKAGAILIAVAKK